MSVQVMDTPGLPYTPLHGSNLHDILADSQDGRCSPHEALDKVTDIGVLRAVIKDQADLLEMLRLKVNSQKLQIECLERSSLTAPGNSDIRAIMDSSATQLDCLYTANGLDPQEISPKKEGSLGGKELDYYLLRHPAVISEILSLRAELQKKNQEVRRKEEEAHCLQFSVESTLGRRLYDKLRDVQRENHDLGNLINDSRVLPVELGVKALHTKVDHLTEGMRKVNKMNKELRMENQFLHSKVSELAQMKIDMQNERDLYQHQQKKEVKVALEKDPRDLRSSVEMRERERDSMSIRDRESLREDLSRKPPYRDFPDRKGDERKGGKRGRMIRPPSRDRRERRPSPRRRN